MDLRESAEAVLDGAKPLLREPPLALGIAGFAAGLLIGVASRAARREKPSKTHRPADAEADVPARAAAPESEPAAVASRAARRRERRQDAIAGAIAGTLATAPMTVVMTSLRRQLPGARRQAIPPRQITRALAARVGLSRALDAEQVSAATYGAHLGYGGALGAVYPTFAAQLGGPPPLAGALFGLLVWGVSYLGWLPASGILRSATREPAGRNVMMIGAHLVWGAATAFLYEATRSAPPEEEAHGKLSAER